MDRIVVGVDGSENSSAALRWALAHAHRAAAPVDVVTVWEQPVAYGGVPAVGAPALTYGGALSEPVDDMRDALRDEAKATIDQALNAAGQAAEGVEVRTHEVEGHAGPVLTEMSKDAGLVVLGRSGHGALVGMLLGSVSQHVSGHAHCPVVLVPGPERAEEDRS